MTNATCSLADCAKPLKRGGFCYGHYMKNWRYGTPTPDHERDGSGWRCTCDCGQERTASVASVVGSSVDASVTTTRGAACPVELASHGRSRTLPIRPRSSARA